MQEAYSREEHSVGWWPASRPPGPAFYAYVYPEPDGLRAAPLSPAGASFDAQLAEFILPYDVVRQAADPDAAAQAFFQSTYEAGADLADWDRALLEPRVPPDRPPTRPWSTLPTRGDAPARATHRHLSRQRAQEPR